MTPEQIAVIRNSHIEHRGGCSSDGFVWPCDTVVALDALAAATEREQAYRAALGQLRAYHGWTVDAYARVYGEPTDDEPSRVIERVLAAQQGAEVQPAEGRAT